MRSTRVTKSAVALIFLVAFLGSNLVAGQIALANNSETETSLIEKNSVTQASNQSDDTVRVDPLDGFKKYRGGYDITNKHYWSSTIFTGIYGYAIAILWLLAGIGYGCFLLAILFCCKCKRTKRLKNRPLYHKQCYLWPIVLAIVFTILAITASGLVLGGNVKFHSRARTIIDIIIDTADDASQTIYNTTGAMTELSDDLGLSNESITIGSSTTNTESVTGFLTSTSKELNATADDIQRQARKNRRLIDKGLRIVYIITMVTFSLNLAAIIALTVCGTLRLPQAIYWLIILCWFLTALCWFFFGLYFFLDNFSRDTCTALENFQQDPYNSSLSSIVPCDELISTKSVLSEVSAGIFNLVNEMNANLSESYSGIVQICNPFSGPSEYLYQQDNCSSNTIKIGDIPQVLKSFVCSNSSNGTCGVAEQLIITPSEYDTLEAYTTSIQNLLDLYPALENLVECQSVKDAFSEILANHCKPLKKYVHMVWASMVILSIAMVFLVLMWTVQARHEQKDHASDGSVKTHSDMLANKAKSTTEAEETKNGFTALLPSDSRSSNTLSKYFKFWDFTFLV